MTRRKIPPLNMVGKAVIGRKIEEAEGRKEETKNLHLVRKENEITYIRQYLAGKRLKPLFGRRRNHEHVD